MKVIRYAPEKENEWNAFVKVAKNATFLFDRGFMDYHSDRFKDHSLMVYNDNENLTACFPANETAEGLIWSHQGLTYGGLIHQKGLKLPVVIEVFQSVLAYYAEKGFKTLRYKAFPRFYNELQTDEIEYCLFLNHAKLYRRDTAIAVNRKYPIKYSGNIRREAKKAKENGVVISEDTDFENFWKNVLIPNLENRFEVKPVHSADEIKFLVERFPNKIKLFTATDSKEKILAGTVFFLTKNVAHCQYISASDEGRRTGALNHLFISLLDEYFLEKRYFDFGIANEEAGRKINTGLLAWKERMGGRTYSHDFYELDLDKITANNV